MHADGGKARRNHMTPTSAKSAWARMTPEPLRVGPLVLAWDDDNQAGVRLSKAGTLGIYRTSRGLWRYICVLDFDEVQEVYGEARKHIEAACRDAERFLAGTGYLAQYRSRRRMLARECERRADKRAALAEAWSRQADGAPGANPQRCRARSLHHKNLAAKYARWAEALRAP